MYVVKRDGRREAVKFDKITARIKKLCYGLNPLVTPEKVAMKVIEGLYDGVTTSELDNLAAEVAATNTITHPDYALLASRIAVSNLHKNTKKSFSDVVKDLYEYIDPKTDKKAPLISDEVYHQIMFNDNVSPSFLQLSKSTDKLIIINSASKSFNMTGWRIGWITHPEELGPHIAKLVQITTTGVPEFLQNGLMSALQNYKLLTREVRINLKKSRDIMFQRLVEWKRVECSVPEAAFYAFFKVKDIKDSLEFAKKLIIDTNVGVAPGIAFGESGEGHLRICFAAQQSFINEIMDRLEPALN